MLKRWCGNVYSTSEGNYQLNYQTFNKLSYKQKVVLAVMLEGKSMPSTTGGPIFCWKIEVP